MAQRVALVTGSSRGIGRAIALRLARDGAAVAVNYRERRDRAEEVVEAITRAGGRAIAIPGDVASASDCTRLVDAARQALGPIEILVNNAGVFGKGDLADFDLSQMEAIRNVNVDGLIRVTRAVAGDMKAKRWGRIVNIASIAGIGTATAGTTFYAATKAAVITLTRRFALDLGPDGITVNAIAPGFIATDMAAASGANFDAIAAKAMMRRVGTPDDVAAAASFLVSEQAGFITAQVLTVDGGRTDFIAHS
ncbi:MAG TPA: glucose 1-dehydrogenase [Burkholderiales bacterium]|nr:glucose 1-dehydrogenase [Burkholderiales bacterium]